MNSFETDLRRAIFSGRFFLGTAIQLAVLWYGGFGSTLYKMTVPIVCTLPYACGWLDEYKGGFVRLSLVRSSLRGYIWGKFLACCISGGGAEVLAAWLYISLNQGEELTCAYGLLFLSAALWAAVASLLAAMSDSKYLAYGGSFVLYYFLVILCERYWKQLYCLYPYEWFAPTHLWIFGDTGIVLLLSGLLLLLAFGYYCVLERRIANA